MKQKNLFNSVGRLFITATMIMCSTCMMADEPLKVSSDKFSRDLLRAWAAAYSAENPGREVEVLSGNDKDADISLSLDDSEGTVVARYALFAVTSTNNPLKGELLGKSLSARDVKRLFFEEDDEDGEDGASKRWKDITVYSGLGSNTSTPLFAQHFKCDPSQLRGRRIAGEDRFLLSAIEKDPQSVTVNYLSYLLDLSTGELRGNIELLPLKLSRQTAEALATRKQEDILAALEKSDEPLITTGHLVLRTASQTASAAQFVNWVAQQGQRLNHANGFLQAKNNSLAQVK